MKLPPRWVMMLIFGAFCAAAAIGFVVAGQGIRAAVFGVLAVFWLAQGAISRGKAKS